MADTAPIQRAPMQVVEQIRRTATAKGRYDQGQFLIEGERLVWRAFKADAPVVLLALARSLADSADGVELLTLARKRDVEVHVVPDAVLLEIAKGRSSGLCVALARLGEPRFVAQWLEEDCAERALLLVAVDVAEPGNVGALLRTALASGTDAVVAQGTTEPFHPKAVRAAMGSSFKLQLCKAGSLEETTGLLRAAGFHQVAAVARAGASLPEAELSAPRLALYVGNEARGLPASLLAQVDAQVTIPMPSSLDSYSLNAAAAIVLYEARCQRSGRRPHTQP